MTASKILSTLLFCTLLPYFSYSQNEHSISEHDDHEDALFEVGISSGLVYLVEEDKATTGFHTHFSRQLSKKIPILVGLGYEYVIDEHQHHTFGILLGYAPVKDLIISASPGFRTNKGSMQFTSHFEVTYGFDISKKLHLGPLLEYAYGKNDNHLTLGAHLGILINRKHSH